MELRTRKIVHVVSLAALLCGCLFSCASGQEFKLEKAIYAADAKQPVAQHVTLFQGSLVVDLKVDFANPPNILETKVYDSRQKKVALMDHSRQVFVEISDNHLLQMVDGLRRDISQRDELQFLINEVFTETQQLEHSRVVLASSTIKYVIKGQRPSDTNYLKIHGEFLDIFTRLPASDPQGFPPFARMRLNDSIKKLGWIPSSIEVEFGSNVLLPKGLKMKSTHVLIDGLSKEDTAKIEMAKKQWLGYKQVSLLKFRGIKQTAAVETSEAKTTEPTTTTK